MSVSGGICLGAVCWDGHQIGVGLLWRRSSLLGGQLRLCVRRRRFQRIVGVGVVGVGVVGVGV
eukprot:4877674-Pleurochrysis_carterae.AAC.1